MSPTLFIASVALATPLPRSQQAVSLQCGTAALDMMSEVIANVDAPLALVHQTLTRRIGAR